MIFRQWPQVLDGTKTQTRRLALDTDYTWICGYRYRADGTSQSLYSEICAENHRRKFVRGKEYAVVPKMGKAAVWVSPDGKVDADPVKYVYDMEYDTTYRRDSRGWKRELGWREARIRITELCRERLQDITEDAAKLEGVSSVAEYRKLWDSLATKGTRWNDNPAVWVITFELVKS